MVKRGTRIQNEKRNGCWYHFARGRVCSICNSCGEVLRR